MTEVVVDLITPGGMKITSSKIPGDCTVREIISDLVDQLELRWNVDGQKIDFKLKWENQGAFLRDDQTLPNAGVTNGQTLRLYSDKKEPGEERVPPPPPTGETVEVALTLQDLHKDIEKVFPRDVQVGTLIKEIISTNSMPERTEKGIPILYKLISKYWGKALSPDRTLAEEGIPAGDRLTLQSKNDAGKL